MGPNRRKWAARRLRGEAKRWGRSYDELSGKQSHSGERAVEGGGPGGRATKDRGNPKTDYGRGGKARGGRGYAGRHLCPGTGNGAPDPPDDQQPPTRPAGRPSSEEKHRGASGRAGACGKSGRRHAGRGRSNPVQLEPNKQVQPLRADGRK